MELVTHEYTPAQTPERKREIAEEIHNQIISSLKRLMEDEGLGEGHSAVVELRGEALIAKRALDHLKTTELLVDAA